MNKKLRKFISIILIAGMLATCQGIPALAMSETVAVDTALESTSKVTYEDAKDAGETDSAEGERVTEANKPDTEKAEEKVGSGDAGENASGYKPGDTDDNAAVDADEGRNNGIPTDGEIVDDTDAENIDTEAIDAEVTDNIEASYSELEIILPEISEEEKVAAAEERATPPKKLGFMPGEIIIEYESCYPQNEIEDLVDQLGGSIKNIMMETEECTFALVQISDDTRVETAIVIYQAHPQIASAGKNVVAFMSSFDTDGTNDPNLDIQYSMKNRSTVAGGAQIFKAWDRLDDYVEEGNSLETVGVTVIDTGCRKTHEELADVVNWDKSYEIYDNLETHPLLGDNYDNGLAQDGKLSHGTHVTGIIGAKADNGKGLVGAASIMGSSLDLSVVDAAQKFTGDTGDVFPIAHLIKAIGVAVNNGARVINMSFGTLVKPEYVNEFSEFENAINAAYNQGVVIVCAAGNNKSSAFAVPSDYASTISVINTDKDANRASTSNYGTEKDICAPGTDIVSTYGSNDDAYKVLSGTSMSAPLVSSVVAMMLSVDSSLTPEEARDILKNTANDLGSAGFDAQYAAGLLDADAALCAVIEGNGGSNNIQTVTIDVNNNVTNSTNNKSGSGGSGGSGGGGGGGFSSDKTEPKIIQGVMALNPVTKKQKFVSSTGQIYRNSWIDVEIKDAAGTPNKTMIYVDANGDVATGWQWIRCADGQIRRFYFSEAQNATYGSYYKSRTTPDGNTVDANGYWTVNGVVQLSGQESIARIPAAEATESAAAAAERAKSPSELGYVPGQLIVKTTGTRQQIDANVALMGGTVAGTTTAADGSSLVVVNTQAHLTTATSETLYKGNPVFTSVTKNMVVY